MNYIKCLYIQQVLLYSSVIIMYLNEKLNFTASLKTSSVKTNSKGKKYAILEGELLNLEPNSNGWAIEEKDMPEIIESYKDKPVKLNHGDDMSIIGTMDDIYKTTGNVIRYLLRIDNPEAVTKLENGEWNTRNMGVSPKFDYADIKCSICNKCVTENMAANSKPLIVNGRVIDLGCGHIQGKTYDNKLAYMIPVKPYALETTVTSNPAYKQVGSGTISNIAVMAASVTKLLASNIINQTPEPQEPNIEKNNEVDSMEQKEVDAAIADRDSQIDVLKAEISQYKDKDSVAMKAELESANVAKLEAETKLTSVNDTVEKMKASIIEKDTIIQKGVQASRESELKEIISDDVLIASILSNKMTDIEFKAEIDKTKKIIELSASKIPNLNGVAPMEGSDSAKATQTQFVASKMKSLFGIEVE